MSCRNVYIQTSIPTAVCTSSSTQNLVILTHTKLRRSQESTWYRDFGVNYLRNYWRIAIKVCRYDQRQRQQQIFERYVSYSRSNLHFQLSLALYGLCCDINIRNRSKITCNDLIFCSVGSVSKRSIFQSTLLALFSLSIHLM